MHKNQKQSELDKESPDAAKKMLGDDKGAVATETKSKSDKKKATSKKGIIDTLFGTPKARLVTFAAAFAIIGVGFAVASFAATAEYFSPNAATSRQGMAAFLYRAAGSPQVSNTKCGSQANQGPFPDVKPDHQFCKEIEWMAKEKITTAYKDGKFKPVNAVSREVAAVFLYRADGSPNTSKCTAKPFEDVPKDSLFCKEIKYAKNRRYITGQNNKYRPTEAATRQAVAAMLYRRSGETISAGTGKFLPRFKDVPRSHPFSDEIEWLAKQEITRGSDKPLVGPTNLDPKEEEEVSTGGVDSPSDAPDVTNTSSSPAIIDASKDPLFGPTFCRGETGSRVSNLQTRLRAMGFLNVATDGIYGPLTEGAVKVWRNIHHKTTESPGCFLPGMLEKFINREQSGWKIDPALYNFLVALGNIPPPVPVQNNVQAGSNPSPTNQVTVDIGHGGGGYSDQHLYSHETDKNYCFVYEGLVIKPRGRRTKDQCGLFAFNPGVTKIMWGEGLGNLTVLFESNPSAKPGRCTIAAIGLLDYITKEYCLRKKNSLSETDPIYWNGVKIWGREPTTFDNF